MCGRFTLAENPADFADEFDGAEFPQQFEPRYNVAPSQPVLAIPNDGRNSATFFLWGLIPSWAKDPAIGNRLINARGETLAEKPAFRGAFKYRRCVIPADGFYEWKAQPGSKLKIPHYIQLKTHKPFGLAGLWEEWQGADGAPIRTCTIVTTEPNELMATIHNRMPVMLGRDGLQRWLDPSPGSPERLNDLIKPFPAALMEMHPVSTLVNSPANERPECIRPI